MFSKSVIFFVSFEVRIRYSPASSVFIQSCLGEAPAVTVME